MRRTDFRGANTYNGQTIQKALLSYKIDGVRILRREQKFVTRNDKVPPGFDTALTDNAKYKIEKYGDCEIYHNNFKETNALLQRHHPESGIIKADDIYPLVELDSRLIINPNYLIITHKQVMYELKKALSFGYEGLVLRTKEKWYRAKPNRTADVIITGYIEQVDKYKTPKGILGGFTTKYGKVTAFYESDRIKFWDNPEQYVGKMMEVQYKELYDTGSFRFAVKFLRFRSDKTEEAFDTRGIMV